MTKWRSGPEKHMRFMGDEEIIQKSCAQSSANVSSVICAGECGFLQKYEQPKDIVDRYDSPRTDVHRRQ